MTTAASKSRGRDAPLRVGSRRVAWPPPWLKLYVPPDPGPAEPTTGGERVDSPTTPDRSVWRSMLAGRPDAERLRWGRRANELEGQGLKWDEAEWLAFQELVEPNL